MPRFVPDENLSIKRKPAISYFRVSTTGQAEDNVSGIDRQERAIQDWLTRYGDRYELEDSVTHAISGVLPGRFDWLSGGVALKSTGEGHMSCDRADLTL